MHFKTPTTHEENGLRYVLIPTHVSDLVPGDVILHGGFLRTVSARNIGRCELLGKTVFGDSYNCGSRPVQRAEIFHARPNIMGRD